MKPLATRRKEMTKVLVDTMNLLDPSGANGKKYKDMMESMSDKEFDKWANDFFNDDDKQLYLEIAEFNRELTYDNIANAAKYLGVPLYEYVASPHLSPDDENTVVTPEPVPVGYAHIKRLQQFILKKNSGSTHINKRNPLTGQVVGDDKNGRNSDAETYGLLNLGAYHALGEFMGPKADDTVMQSQMLGKIETDGFVTERDMTNDPANKTALATLDAYFTLQGLRTNVYTPINEIPKAKLIKRK